MEFEYLTCPECGSEKLKIGSVNDMYWVECANEKCKHQGQFQIGTITFEEE